MEHSPEQLTIFDFVPSGRNLIIEAVAGAGKTTTIAEIAKLLPKGFTRVALCFNKATAEAFQAKLPYWVTSSTFHALCNNAISSSFKTRPKISGDKLKWLLKDNFNLAGAYNERHDKETAILRLTAMRKQQVGELSENDLYALAERFGIEASSEVISISNELLALSDSDLSRIDFDDMLRFALADSVSFSHVATLFVDEAQDTNSAQRALLHKIKPAQLIAVGDPHQAIYGFRGADSSALSLIKEEFNCETLPLSVSWRCSQTVVAEARRVLERIL